MVVAGACSITPDGAVPPDAVRLRAADLRFEPGVLDVPPGPWRLALENVDRDVAHDVAIYRTDRLVHHTATTFGESITTFEMPALAPGQYRFRCEIHPATMVGTLTVDASTSPPSVRSRR